MNNTALIGLLVILVVAFFGYQWWSKGAKRPAPPKKSAPVPAVPVVDPTPTAAPVPKAAAGDSTPVYPTVPGQTEAELRAKEPLQERAPPSNQQPVTPEGHGPAQFESNLRHPEQAFHQPQGPAPSLKITDMPAGNASMTVSPQGASQQMFSPEMAQNGGAFIGNSVFAFDGEEGNVLTSF
jgi:hypothetical protein